MNAWWTPEQVAEYYQIPLKTVWQKIRLGEIRAKNIGTSNRHIYRISAAEIRRYDQAA